MVELLGRYSNWTSQLKRCRKTLALVDETWPPRESVPVSVPRKMTQRLDEPQVSALVAGYGAGKTGRELAAEFGVARNSVIKLLRQQGVEIRHARVTPEESAEIVELFEGGMAQYKIAEKVGRGPGQIWHVLHRAGLVGKH